MTEPQTEEDELLDISQITFDQDDRHSLSSEGKTDVFYDSESVSTIAQNQARIEDSTFAQDTSSLGSENPNFQLFSALSNPDTARSGSDAALLVRSSGRYAITERAKSDDASLTPENRSFKR